MAEKLAIYPDLPKIVELVKSNTVSAVIAPTGSGKSIGVIWSLIREGLTVMCTQPTIPAATSLYEYQKKLSPEFSIGFAAEGTIKYNDQSNAVYCTAGHLRKVMKGRFKAGKAFPMMFTDILFIDEIHVGSRDNSIIIDLWIEAFKQGVKVPRLVLATATEYGCHELLENLAKLTSPKNPKPAVFRSTFRHYPVEVRYQMRDYSEPDSEYSFSDAARIAVDLLVEKKGHGIVFCSGAEEVEDVAWEIEELINSKNLRNAFQYPVEVIGVFGQSKREDIEEAICDENEKPEDKRMIKIVVTTNLCESSLTVPDVIFIVDMLSEKRSSLIRGRFHLGTTWISKNSADQRKGRTGRTLRNGVCFRMCSKEFYEKLEDFRPPEILRTPIADIIIEFMTIGLDPVKVITELDPVKLEEAKQVLIETGCILVPEIIKTEQELHDEMFPPLKGGAKPRLAPQPTVSQKGYFVAEIPMDVRNASAMFDYLNGSKEDNNFWALVAFIVVDTYGPSLFWFPRKEKNEDPKRYRVRLQGHILEHFMEFRGANPVESLCNALYHCFESLSGPSPRSTRNSDKNLDLFNNRTGLDAPYRKVRDWAVENSCNNKKLREIIVQIKRIQKTLQRYTFPGIPDPANKNAFLYRGKKSCEYIPKLPNPMVNIRSDISKAFTDAYKTKIILPSGYKYYCPADMSSVTVDTMKTVSILSPGPQVLPLSEIHIKNSKGEQIMISLWMNAWVDQRALYASFGYNYNYDSSSE